MKLIFLILTHSNIAYSLKKTPIVCGLVCIKLPGPSFLGKGLFLRKQEDLTIQKLIIPLHP